MKQKKQNLFVLVLVTVIFTSNVSPVFAAEDVSDFSNSSHYTYDSSVVEVSSSTASLKATSTWYDTDWSYRKKITVDNTKVSANLTDFPVFISTDDSDITTNSQSDWDDLLFTSNDGLTKLNHEVEKPTSTSGAISYLSSWSESTPFLQGVATDGTRIYVTAKGASYPGKLLKYTKNGTLITSTTTLPTATQIADVYYKDNYLYVADATEESVKASSTGGRIIRFNASDLSYDSVVLDEGILGYFSEGVTFYDNHWWLGFYAGSDYPEQDSVIRKYDSSCDFVKEYTLSDSSGDVQGIDFYEQNGKVYLAMTSHNSHPRQSGTVQIFEYNSQTDSFTFETEKTRISGHLHPQGLFFEDRTDGAVVWFADRVNGLISKEDFSNVVDANTTNPVYTWAKIPSLSGSADTDLYLYYGNSSSTDQSTPADAWDSNYKGVWHLGEDPVVEGARDSTSNNNDSATSTSESGDLVTGKTGLSLGFAANDYVEIADDTSITPDYITTSAWIKTDGIDDKAIISKTGGGSYLLSAWFPDSDNLYFTVNIGGSYYSASADKSLVTDNAWHYVVGTYDGSNVRIYVDGALKDTVSQAGVIDHGSALPNLRIGAEAGNPDNFFNGSIDEARISSSARGSDWISTEYNNQNSPATFSNMGSEEVPYSSENPTIQPISSRSFSFGSLSGFTETATKNGGEIKYQFSNDGGSTWYWYDGSWKQTSAGYSEASTAGTMNTNAASFPTGDGDFLWRAYLSSNDGTQTLQLDSISVDYSAESNTSSVSTGGGLLSPRGESNDGTEDKNVEESEKTEPKEESVSIEDSVSAENIARLKSQIKQLRARIEAIMTNKNLVQCVFSRNLTVGMTGEDVQCLQTYLNQSGFVVASTGEGAPGEETRYFGLLTKEALIEFQEANAGQILTPVNLSEGTGYFGRSTRAFINEAQ